MRRKLAQNEEMAIRAVSIEVAEEPPYRTRTGPVDVRVTSRRCRGVVQTGAQEMDGAATASGANPRGSAAGETASTARDFAAESARNPAAVSAQQNILAVLNGKPVLPDDPILRAAALRYTGYFRLAGAGLEPLVKREDLLPDARGSVGYPRRR